MTVRQYSQIRKTNISKLYQIYEEESSMEFKICKGCKFCVAVEDDVGKIKYYCDLDNEEIEVT